MYIFALSLLSCQSSSESGFLEEVESSDISEVALLNPIGSCDVSVERIGSGSDVVSISPYEWIQQHQDTTLFIDEHLQTESTMDSAERYDGERFTIQQTLLVLDGEIFVMMDGVLASSPINDVLPVPIQQVQVMDGNVWLLGAGRLFRWTGEEVREVSVHSSSNILDMLGTSSGTLAITTPKLEVLELVDNALQTHMVPKLLPTSMGSTLSKRLLVSEGAPEIHMYLAGGWTQFEIAGVGEVNRLMASIDSDLVWIKGTENSFVYDRGQVCTLDDDVDGDWLTVDDLGRLMVHRDDDLYRYSMGQPVAVVGMLSNERLDISRELFFLPTLEETLIDFSVWVGSYQLDVNGESNSTVLNPESFERGTHTLRMVAEGTEGTSITEFPFVIGELSESSWADVEPIYLENCTSCHHQSALIPLDTLQLWQQNIDVIIEEVSAQTMPLGATPLTEEEILVIRGWKQGGFQE